MEQSHRIASRTRVSEKTVRSIMWKLRFALMEAVTQNRDIFRGIRRYIFDGGQMLPRGQELLEDAGKSATMNFYIEIHRLDPYKLSERQFGAIMMENAVRAYCRMVGQPGGLFEASSELRANYATIMETVEGLMQAEVTVENMVEHAELVAEAQELLEVAEGLLDAEQRLAVADAYRWSVNPNQTIYNDLRRYLLRNPF